MKLYQKRLEEKYGKTDIRGRKLETVMKEIIQHNTTTISDSMAKYNYKKFKVQKGTMIMPDLSQVMPKHAVYARKTQLEGDMIKQGLKDQLTGTLRGVIEKYQEKGLDYKRMKGAGQIRQAGQLKNQIVVDFEKQIEKVFEGYVKKDPRYDMPGNIHTIAVTEVRSVISLVKKEFKDGVLKANPDYQAKKTWIQNKSLAKEYRRSHNAIDGTSQPDDMPFQVPLYQRQGKRWLRTGQVVAMDHPHDPKAPAGEVIGCNCDIIYSFVKRATNG